MWLHRMDGGVVSGLALERGEKGEQGRWWRFVRAVGDIGARRVGARAERRFVHGTEPLAVMKKLA